MNKKYILEQIKRVELIIEKSKNNIKITEYGKERINEYRDEITKYDLSQIRYNNFKNSFKYSNFKIEILLKYLDEIINKAYELELLDNTFSY